MYWTNGQPFLTQRLCQQILESDIFISNGNEQVLVAQLVQAQVISDWESQDVSVHLKTIRDRILADKERISRLFGLYQQVLDNCVDINDTFEQAQLRLTGLVVEKQGQLQVANRIYANIFNRHWVERQLERLCPYAEAMNAWLASECQDESRLLRGKALIDAQTWATGKSLSDEDYKFLATGQQAEKKIIEAEKRLAEEQLDILEEAKFQLTASVQKVRSNRVSNVYGNQGFRKILAPSLSGFFISGFIAILSYVSLLNPLDNIANDLLIQSRGARDWNDELIIIGVDNRTL